MYLQWINCAPGYGPTSNTSTVNLMVGLTGYIVTELDPSVLTVGELLLKVHKLASLKNHIPSQLYHVMGIFLLKMCYILKLAS